MGVAQPSPAQLLARAREIAGRAHAPYSGIKVGAVAVGLSGSTHEGVTVESAASGLMAGRRHGVRSACVHEGVTVESAAPGMSLCAERAAVARAIVDGDGPIVRIALARHDGEPIAPCGGCRQVLAEAGADVVVVLQGPHGPVERQLRELLPDPFLLP